VGGGGGWLLDRLGHKRKVVEKVVDRWWKGGGSGGFNKLNNGLEAKGKTQ
jgi:hypothetical protein